MWLNLWNTCTFSSLRVIFSDDSENQATVFFHNLDASMKRQLSVSYIIWENSLKVLPFTSIVALAFGAMSNV